MSNGRSRSAIAILAGSGTNTLIVSIQAVVLIPLYLNAIGPRLYGAWLGSGDILLWMMAFDLGLPNLMIQRIGAAHGKSDTKTVSEYFATGMLVLAAVAFSVALAAYVLSFYLSGWLGITGADAEVLRSCFLIGSIAAAINIFNNSVVGFSRAIQDAKIITATIIASSLGGFVVSLVLILAGYGLWSVAFGLLARALISLIGSAYFLRKVLKGDLVRYFKVRRQILRELLVISPATALGGLGYAVMNQSEVALVAFFIRPELAVVFSLTRKVLEIARGIIDMIAFATYGSFANLVTSDQKHRTLAVHSEISSLRLSLAVVGAAAYMVINESLVSKWVGNSQYGGPWLTVFFAVQFIVVGSSFLLNYLYRATGPVMRGSLALVAESALRVPLMILLLLWMGLPGIPIAGILTGGIFWYLAYRWTVKEVVLFSQPTQLIYLKLWIGRLVTFTIGVLGCFFVWSFTWSYIVISGFIVSMCGCAALLYLDPQLVNVHLYLNKILFWLKSKWVKN